MLQTFDERNASIVYWCNGVLRHRDEPGISPFDSVVQGGDAVWEGLRVYDGRIYGLEPHLARLRRSAHVLGFAAIPETAWSWEARSCSSLIGRLLPILRSASAARKTSSLLSANAFVAAPTTPITAVIAATMMANRPPTMERAPASTSLVAAAAACACAKRPVPRAAAVISAI